MISIKCIPTAYVAGRSIAVATGPAVTHLLILKRYDDGRPDRTIVTCVIGVKERKHLIEALGGTV